jgi:hypothetical protein
MNPKYVSQTGNSHVYYICKIPILLKELKFNTFSLSENQESILLDRFVVLRLLEATKLLIVPLFSFSFKNQLIISCRNTQTQAVVVNDNSSQESATILGYRKSQKVLVNKLKSFIGNLQRFPSTP